MKVTDFARKITLEEGLKESVSIAQVKEILKIINQQTDGQLYKLIREK